MKIICKHNQNTMRYNRYPNGIQVLGEVNSLSEFISRVKLWEDDRIQEESNGTILDSVNGTEVYDPKYPLEFDFGDYSYELITNERG